MHVHTYSAAVTAALDRWLPWHVSARVSPFKSCDCLGVGNVGEREHLGGTQTPGKGERPIPYLDKAIILCVWIQNIHRCLIVLLGNKYNVQSK